MDDLSHWTHSCINLQLVCNLIIHRDRLEVYRDDLIAAARSSSENIFKIMHSVFGLVIRVHDHIKTCLFFSNERDILSDKRSHGMQILH